MHIATAKEPGPMSKKDFLDDQYRGYEMSAESYTSYLLTSSSYGAYEVFPWVNYLVLPLFAFSNAGVVLGDMSGSAVFGVAIAIAIALFLGGKTIGIFTFTYIATKLNIVKGTHTRCHLRQCFRVSIFGGIGFTVSYLTWLNWLMVRLEVRERSISIWPNWVSS